MRTAPLIRTAAGAGISLLLPLGVEVAALAAACTCRPRSALYTSAASQPQQHNVIVNAIAHTAASGNVIPPGARMVRYVCVVCGIHLRGYVRITRGAYSTVV